MAVYFPLKSSESRYTNVCMSNVKSTSIKTYSTCGLTLKVVYFDQSTTEVNNIIDYTPETLQQAVSKILRENDETYDWRQDTSIPLHIRMARDYASRGRDYFTNKPRKKDDGMHLAPGEAVP